MRSQIESLINKYKKEIKTLEFYDEMYPSSNYGNARKAQIQTLESVITDLKSLMN
jgi:hypothetical protein